jgi:site-specific recombinase XerD
MASIYSRPGRLKWYASIRDPETLKWKDVTTPFRLSDVAGRRKALVWASEQDRLGAATIHLAAHETWDQWVNDWLKFHYGHSPRTLRRYLTVWYSLNDFLHHHHIQTPRQVEYRHAQMYLIWRTKQTRKGGKFINYNTAILEVKVLARIMKEAQMRDYCEGSPLYQMGLKRRNVKVKPEITEEERWIITRGLRAEGPKRQWMRIMFIIAMHQGCRKSETALLLSDVSIERGTIKFVAKGNDGKPHVFTTALHPRLKHLFRWMRKKGFSKTCEPPPHESRVWWAFWQRVGLPHLSFHSTRVTVVTQMARNGVQKQKAMRFIGHASETVHQIYERLVPEDVADVADAIRF